MSNEQLNATTNQKETNELFTFLGLSVNGVSKDLKDDRFGNLSDHLQTILAAQPAFQGLGAFGSEASVATIADKDSRLEMLKATMSDTEENTAYDLAAGLHGLHCLYSLGKRQGREEAKAELRAELEAAGVDFSSVRSLS